MTDDTISVPREVLERMRPENPVHVRTAAMQDALSRLKPPTPTLVLVDIREATSKTVHDMFGAHGSVEFDAAYIGQLPDPMTLIEQAVRDTIHGGSTWAEETRAAVIGNIRAALEGATQ